MGRTNLICIGDTFVGRGPSDVKTSLRFIIEEINRQLPNHHITMITLEENQPYIIEFEINEKDSTQTKYPVPC